MKKRRVQKHDVIVPVMMFLIFWGLAITLWLLNGHIFFLINFGYIGTSLGIGMLVYNLLPREKKHLGRKLALLLVGLYMFGFLGLVGKENMQIEGFFFYLLAGVTAGAVMHYMIAKVFGPLIFGRGWCGWACWTVMVLDLLPFSHSSGRVDRRWEWLRYVHFAISLGLVAALWYGVGYRLDFDHPHRSLIWLLTGNILYFGSGIALAVLLRDNRAFCKYLCPITVILKATARFALFKVRGQADQCTGCGTCERVCPMDIRVAEYVKQGTRVLSTECIFCQNCLHACPTQCLKLTCGFDMGGKELLRERKKEEMPREHVVNP